MEAVCDSQSLGILLCKSAIRVWNRFSHEIGIVSIGRKLCIDCFEIAPQSKWASNFDRILHALMKQSNLPTMFLKCIDIYSELSSE